MALSTEQARLQEQARQASLQGADAMKLQKATADTSTAQSNTFTGLPQNKDTFIPAPTQSTNIASWSDSLTTPSAGVTNIAPTSGIGRVTEAGQHFKDILGGKDSFTNQLLNRYSEESATREAATRGLAGQKAELSGASESQQALMERETTRDLEQARHMGQAELAASLGQRQDQAAGQLVGIGKYESDVAYKAYNDFISSADLTKPENATKAVDMYKGATGQSITIDGLVDKQMELKKDKSFTELTSYLSDNALSFWNEDTKSYDIFDTTSGEITDPIARGYLEEAWSNTSLGQQGVEFDETNEVVKDWVDKQVGSATTSDIEEGIIARQNAVVQTSWFKGMTPEEQSAFLEADRAHAESAALLGYDPTEEDEFGFSAVVDFDGNIISANDTVTNENGTWELNRTGGTVTQTTTDGVTTTYKLTDDGWATVVNGTETKVDDATAQQLGLDGIDIKTTYADASVDDIKIEGDKLSDDKTSMEAYNWNDMGANQIRTAFDQLDFENIDADDMNDILGALETAKLEGDVGELVMDLYTNVAGSQDMVDALMDSDLVTTLVSVKIIGDKYGGSFGGISSKDIGSPFKVDGFQYPLILKSLTDSGTKRGDSTSATYEYIDNNGNTHTIKLMADGKVGGDSVIRLYKDGDSKQIYSNTVSDNSDVTLSDIFKTIQTETTPVTQQATKLFSGGVSKMFDKFGGQ